ncbi:MAG: hypothetical protein UT39_C0001G0027 [Candidatus Woesebacteria bacterium GW2011_GWA1_39_21]|uniref:Uncharacterized protein n=1 Tax=Candidatus Woesebacteria bacterium GW2011_GWA1_39_21 TaxID=1618550 RepID=A0A0G0RE80_9BACT|nr:MAG: hypothetical protein UT39_C0001G0027 [Candidatus Woesebacteria bacterium GW2011_GWA1_39_21]
MIRLVLETPHVIVAAAIAVKTGNPFLAVSLSFFSHFVLDEVPHWNPHITNQQAEVKTIDSKSLKIIIADSTLALVLGSIIAASFLPNVKQTILVLACCFASVLPDLIEAPYIFLNYKKPWMKKILFFQKNHQFNTNVFLGFATQIVVIVASILWMTTA